MKLPPQFGYQDALAETTRLFSRPTVENFCGPLLLRRGSAQILMAIYLAKYHPLCSTRSGEQAARRFNIPPFVDGSCRREPDLESEKPSISALCREDWFAPKLRTGDTVVYATVKGLYGTDAEHWRVIAILHVRLKLSHTTAAEWYGSKGIDLPGNCMVPHNAPNPMNQTTRASDSGGVEQWDEDYWRLSVEFPVFLVCEAECRELHSPPIVSSEENRNDFQGKFSNQNPVELTPEELARLQRRFRC